MRSERVILIRAMSSLISCSACQRHCLSHEAACPFCGARRLAVGAGIIAFAALGVGWSGDAGPDARPQAPDATSPDGKAPTMPPIEHQPIPLYGVPPSGRGGCGHGRAFEG